MFTPPPAFELEVPARTLMAPPALRMADSATMTILPDFNADGPVFTLTEALPWIFIAPELILLLLEPTLMSPEPDAPAPVNNSTSPPLFT